MTTTERWRNNLAGFKPIVDSEMRGYRCLDAAILRQAVVDLQTWKYPGRGQPSGVAYIAFRSAAFWMFCEPSVLIRDWPITFKAVCGRLDLAPGVVRRRTLDQIGPEERPWLPGPVLAAVGCI